MRTNWYATMVDDEGHVLGGVRWKPLTIAKLKFFLAITLYMGMQKNLIQSSTTFNLQLFNY